MHFFARHTCMFDESIENATNLHTNEMCLFVLHEQTILFECIGMHFYARIAHSRLIIVAHTSEHFLK